MGRLQNFQRHKLRAWAIYDMNFGRGGSMSVSGLVRVDSSLAYSLAQRVAPTATQRVHGGRRLPVRSVPRTCSSRRAAPRRSPRCGLLDTSVHYNVPLFSDLRPWIKFDVYNLMNNQKPVRFSTTVSQNAATSADNLGLRTGYTPAATFGKATGNTVTNLNQTAIPTRMRRLASVAPTATAAARSALRWAFASNEVLRT